MWGLTPDGEYPVKSRALLAQGLAFDPPPPKSFVWIWKMCIPPKTFYGRAVMMACQQKLGSKLAMFTILKSLAFAFSIRKILITCYFIVLSQKMSFCTYQIVLVGKTFLKFNSPMMILKSS